MNRLDKFAIALIILALGFLTFLTRSPFSLGCLAGAVILAVYGFATGQKDLVAIAPFLPAFGLLALWANYAVYLITPHTIDGKLALIDHGIAISIWRWSSRHDWIFNTLSVIYYGLGVVAGISICSTSRRKELIRCCIIAAFTAPLFYILFPAVGPGWVGHPAARNCVPSLHFTWALLLFLYCSNRIKLFMGVFLVLTAWATMGLGQHYAIDLVVALPFTAACIAASRLTVPNNPILSSE